MNRTKIIVIGAMMASLAAIFQSFPVLLSEAAVLLTMLSAIPIYIASRINPTSGVLSYLVAAFLILLISTHEAFFSYVPNGVVGLTLGICSHERQKKPATLIISSATLSLSLSIMNYGLGIPIFGADIPGAFPVQFIILILFSFAYNLFFLYFTNIIYYRINRLIKWKE